MINLLGASDSFDDVLPAVRRSLEVEGATVHLYGKKESRKGRKLGHVTVVGASDARVRQGVSQIVDALPSPYRSEEDIITREYPGTDGLSHPHPLVSIIMGSDSDLPVMKAAAGILGGFGVPFELNIVSAHRTPLLMTQFAQEAEARGVKVIIAGAGGAAHLPGMVAALTPLPVIGVPVKGSTLDGVDSLHSIVQMPVCIFSSASSLSLAH
jgi:phosphoribosylaminoimidazole carboxylase